MKPGSQQRRIEFVTGGAAGRRVGIDRPVSRFGPQLRRGGTMVRQPVQQFLERSGDALVLAIGADQQTLPHKNPMIRSV